MDDDRRRAEPAGDGLQAARGRARALLFLAVPILWAAASCASRSLPSVGGGTAPQSAVGAVGSGGNNPNVGSVGLQLVLAPGLGLYSVNWTIANGGASYSGAVDLGDAQITGGVEFVAGGILAGSGYVLTLSATDSNGDPCSGASDPFTVMASAVSTVGLLLTCVIPTDAAIAADIGTGAAGVDGGVTVVIQPPLVCPSIASFSISPSALAPNQAAQCSVTTNGPTPAIMWSVTPASGGTFSDPTSASPTFQCAQGGTSVTVTAQVGLPDSGACDGLPYTSLSALVDCLAPPAPACPDGGCAEGGDGG